MAAWGIVQGWNRLSPHTPDGRPFARGSPEQLAVKMQFPIIRLSHAPTHHKSPHESRKVDVR